MSPRTAMLLVTSALVAAGPTARAEIIQDLEREMESIEAGASPPQHISAAHVRVAVFTYEDPDRTGLGNGIAALVANQILLGARLKSLAVIRYASGGLAPSSVERLSYFDKVDAVTRAQGVVLSVWGSIRKVGDGFVLDSFVQLQPGWELL